MRAKKSYGQHFLRHPAIASRIADQLDHPAIGGHVLEVGPGKGILTRFVAERWPAFLAVEADPDMVVWLASRHPEWTGHIREGDFLHLDLNALFDGLPFGLIGNFPYNISSQIVFRMLEHRSLIPVMVGMFQREVARRIVAPPGNKEYGILSVLAQTWYAGEYLFTVNRESFDPPPRVQSGVIRLVRRENPNLPCRDADLYRVVKTAFGQRRKMLRNSLREMVPEPSWLEEPGFALRPEQLRVEDFHALTARLYPVE